MAQKTDATPGVTQLGEEERVELNERGVSELDEAGEGWSRNAEIEGVGESMPRGVVCALGLKLRRAGDSAGWSAALREERGDVIAE